MKRHRDYLEKPLPGWITGSIEERFTRIYERGFWGEPESASGPGSAWEQTRVLVRELPILFNRLAIRTLLDVPCGDFNWMRELDVGLDDDKSLGLWRIALLPRPVGARFG